MTNEPDSTAHGPAARDPAAHGSAALGSAAHSVVLEQVRLASGHLLDLTLGPGVHAFYADASEPLADATLHELCAVLTGWRSPRRGRVRIAGKAPHRDPAIRRRIASVLGEEPPLIGSTVGQHLDRVTAALGIQLGSADGWLDAWRSRPALDLTATERRAVAAALAFSSEAPVVAVLHEPTRLGAHADAARILQRLAAWKEAGVVVICTTTDARAAARLGAAAWSLTRAPHPPERAAEYLVRTSAARALAARLADHPAVTALRYDAGLPRDLWVRGTELAPLADALQAALLAEGCELDEMTRLHGTGDASPEAGARGGSP
jgi:hypothetical protein